MNYFAQRYAQKMPYKHVKKILFFVILQPNIKKTTIFFLNAFKSPNFGVFFGNFAQA